MPDLTCVAHVHSTYSDGSATVAELLEACRQAGVEVLLLTDHDTLAARRDGWEGWHEGVLLLVGHEVTPPGGHYLAFGLEEEITADGRSEEEIAAAVIERGGIGFAAHPWSNGSRMPGALSVLARPHPWRTLDRSAGAGVELWSLTTDAAEDWRSPLEAVRYILDPEKATDGPRPEHLRAWDRLGRARRVPAIGGLDAHQHGSVRFRGRLHSLMPNRRYFRILRTHVVLDDPLTGELGADRDAVLQALGAGRSYLACDFRAPATGFSFTADGPEGTVPMGAERRAGAYQLEMRTPVRAAVRIVRDGAPVAEAPAADALTAAAEGPGVYRAEARLDGRTWILSNAIYLR